MKRNFYRNLVIEFYARNSSSVLALTHRHWPDSPWTSQPELARLLSAELGCELDYRSLSRQLRRVHRFDHAVRERIFTLIDEIHSLWQMELTTPQKCSTFAQNSVELCQNKQ